MTLDSLTKNYMAIFDLEAPEGNHQLIETLKQNGDGSFSSLYRNGSTRVITKGQFEGEDRITIEQGGVIFTEERKIRYDLRRAVKEEGEGNIPKNFRVVSHFTGTYSIEGKRGNRKANLTLLERSKN